MAEVKDKTIRITVDLSPGDDLSLETLVSEGKFPTKAKAVGEAIRILVEKVRSDEFKPHPAPDKPDPDTSRMAFRLFEGRIPSARLEILKEIIAKGGTCLASEITSVKKGTLYVTLQRMEAAGLIELKRIPRPKPEVGIARVQITVKEGIEPLVAAMVMIREKLIEA